jgi:polyphosphate kinase
MVTQDSPTENQPKKPGDYDVQGGDQDVPQATTATPGSLLYADYSAAWLAELDALTRVTADTSVDLSVRLEAMGSAAALTDAIFENGLPSPMPSQLSDDLDVGEQSRRLTSGIGSRLDQIGRLLDDSILPSLAERESIHVLSVDVLDERQRVWLRTSFMQQIFPLLTPLAVDPSRPFPQLESGSLMLLTVLHNREDDQRFDGPVIALIQVPDVLPRWLPICSNVQGGQEAGRWFDVQTYGPGVYAWSESVVRSHIALLFPGMHVIGTHLFRILRPKHSLSRPGGRRVSSRVGAMPLVRLDVEENMPPTVRQWLVRHLDAQKQGIVRSHPPMAMADMTTIAERLSLRKRGFRGWIHQVKDLFFGHI